MCRVCGREGGSDRETGHQDDGVCPACRSLGFDLGTSGEVLCPECGDDYHRCACTVPKEGGIIP